MKPRSLFDNPEAWVNLEFKPIPKPQTPVVFLAPAKPKDEPAAATPPAPEPKTPPKPPARAPYGKSYSPAVRKIVKAVSKISGVSVQDLKGPLKLAEYLGPRMVICYLAHTFTDRSLPLIGRELGGRDHTTILSNKRKIEKLIRDRQIEAPEDGTIEAWAKLLLRNMKAMQDERRERYRTRQPVLNKAWRERQKELKRASRLARAKQ